MTKPSVFISYSNRDRDWAQAFAQSLKDSGVKVWFDRWELDLGRDWRATAEKALRESDVIAVVVNPEEASRPDLLFEVGAAVGMGKRVVPIVPSEVENSELPFPLRTRQGIRKETPEVTAQKLVAATRRQ